VPSHLLAEEGRTAVAVHHHAAGSVLPPLIVIFVTISLLVRLAEEFLLRGALMRSYSARAR
jgi:membrane protease YdiL (CAAX protease family)